MNYTFPPTKFAEENTPGQQLQHVLSEMRETLESYEKFEDAHRIEEEMLDTMHSIETYIRIREKHQPGEIGKSIDHVQSKNERRGYYLKRHACTVFGSHPPHLSCLMDEGRAYDCDMARVLDHDGKTKKACPHWREI